MKIYRLLIVSCIKIAVCQFQKPNIISILYCKEDGKRHDMTFTIFDFYIEDSFLIFTIRTQMYTYYVYEIAAQIESGSIEKMLVKNEKKNYKWTQQQELQKYCENGTHSIFICSLPSCRWFAINSTWTSTHTHSGHMSRQIYLHTRVCTNTQQKRERSKQRKIHTNICIFVVVHTV